MRGKLIISAAALAVIGISVPAVADYMYPGQIVIGYGPPKPPPDGNTGGKTRAMVGPGCVLKHPLVCDCFPDLPVLEACHHSGVDTECLEPGMPYNFVEQPEPVVIDLGQHVLGSLVCTAKSKQTAHVFLPPPPP